VSTISTRLAGSFAQAHANARDMRVFPVPRFAEIICTTLPPMVPASFLISL
jgi:hypothetical protein